jgi:LysR family transcriptional regulator, transcription activator of glutamate synthase operon
MAMTIHQLRIFWAVAQAKSYTKASKMLGLAQPSLSQQISKLEEEVGSRLFNRGFSQIQLTDTGDYLYTKAEEIIASIEETEEELKQFSKNTRGVLKIGMLSSVARNILPPTMKLFYSDMPDIEINVLEVAPAEAIDLLYARQLNIAVVAEDSIAASNLSFASTEIYTDPYVLAVPTKINLEKIDTIKQLNFKEREVMNSSIIFEFGNQHKKRIDDWFKKNKIAAKIIAHTRSYEVALSMVEAGLGVAVLPALTAVIGLNRSYDVSLYKTNLTDRRLVSLAQKQFVNTEPTKTFIKNLVQAGKELKLPKIKEVPNFLTKISKEFK